MLIWTRWGFFGFIFIGLGVGVGFLLKAAFGLGAVDESAINGTFVGIGFLMAAIGLYFLDGLLVRARLDKPRVLMVPQQVPPLPNGQPQPPRMVPAIEPGTNKLVVVRPRSTMFGIPLQLWPYLIALLGLVVLIINVVRLLVG